MSDGLDGFGEMMFGTGNPLGPHVKPGSVKSSWYRSQMPRGLGVCSVIWDLPVNNEESCPFVSVGALTFTSLFTKCSAIVFGYQNNNSNCLKINRNSIPASFHLLIDEF